MGLEECGADDGMSCFDSSLHIKEVFLHLTSKSFIVLDFMQSDSIPQLFGESSNE